jgi:hypothetical protein
LLKRLVACFLLVFMGISLLSILDNEYEKRELAKSEGVFYPDKLPRPETRCNIRQGDFAIFVGTDVWYGDRFFLSFSINGNPIMAADIDENNKMRLSFLRVYDDRKDIIAKVYDHRKLWVSPSARKERTTSTLKVFDHSDAEVLNIMFLNSNTIKILGRFRSKFGGPPVIVTDSSTTWQSNNRSVGNCLEGRNGINLVEP